MSFTHSYDLSGDDGHELPEGIEKCPACGRFVSDKGGKGGGFGDVEPGGQRGIDLLVLYCNEACTAKVNCRHGHSLNGPCTDGCEQ